MSVLNDLMEGLPEMGGMLKNLDLGSLMDKLPDIGGLIENLPDISGILGPFDPIDLISKIDLSGIVASVGETALDLLGGLPMVRNAG
jgi:hypothetical protein